MRLPTDFHKSAAVLLAATSLAGCSVFGGGGNDVAAVPQGNNFAAARDMLGPAGDYPVVIGEPFTVDGVEYVPADTLNYDQVGYGVQDAAGSAGVSASHRTLPLPSYVEVTSLDTGKTILVRVERRGPMSGNALIALSPDAQAQLGEPADNAVRVRRVNPVEIASYRAASGQPSARPHRYADGAGPGFTAQTARCGGGGGLAVFVSNCGASRHGRCRSNICASDPNCADNIRIVAGISPCPDSAPDSNAGQPSRGKGAKRSARRSGFVYGSRCRLFRKGQCGPGGCEDRRFRSSSGPLSPGSRRPFPRQGRGRSGPRQSKSGRV